MVLVMADSQAPVSSMTRVARSSFSTMGSFEVKSPSHFPSTLLKSVTAVGCHWRVSQGAMELQATMRYKKAKPINPTIFFIYILLWQSNGKVKKYFCALMGLDALRGLLILVSCLFNSCPI